MLLKQLKLVNFRNYDFLEVKSDHNLVILLGDNAQGKTNFLEAIYLLAITKSFRLRNDFGLVKDGKEVARIEAIYSSRGQEAKIEVAIRGERVNNLPQKIIKINGIVAPAKKILGSFLAVLFCPEDINLVRAAPGARRRFLDIAACKVSNVYCENLVWYNKVLRNRNQVLARIKKGFGKREELVFWNNELASKGALIMGFRWQMVVEMSKMAAEYYRIINGGKKEKKMWQLHYLSSIHTDLKETNIDALKLILRSELLKREEVDILRQQTTVGPHRDDFSFILNRRNIIHQGSRGEMRSAILALKFAEIDFLEKRLNERPILLLDDVFSELDASHKKQVVNLLSKQQTFIATTEVKEDIYNLKNKALVIKIKDGKAT